MEKNMENNGSYYIEGYYKENLGFTWLWEFGD